MIEHSTLRSHKGGSTILISFLNTPLIDHYNYTHMNLSQKNDDMTCVGRVEF